MKSSRIQAECLKAAESWTGCVLPRREREALS
jgi:hypothetical protein